MIFDKVSPLVRHHRGKRNEIQRPSGEITRRGAQMAGSRRRVDTIASDVHHVRWPWTATHQPIDLAINDGHFPQIGAGDDSSRRNA